MSTGLLHVVYMIKKTRIFFVKDEGKKASHKIIFFFINASGIIFDIQSFWIYWNVFKCHALEFSAR